MPEQLSELIVSTIVGLISSHYAETLSDKINDYFDSQQRQKDLKRRVSDLLNKAKEEAYYEDFDKFISKTNILNSVFCDTSLFSGRERFIRHLNDIIESNDIKHNNVSNVKGLMIKIFDESMAVFIAPDSNEERRLQERITQTGTMLAGKIDKLLEEDRNQQVVKNQEQVNKLHLEYSRYVEGAKESAKIFGILPVMNPNIAFQNAFPKLFVKPFLLFGENEVCYADFINKYMKDNVVILADAGCGKSTLLKYIAQFENLNAVYFTAQTLKENKRILELIEEIYGATSQEHLFLLVDGLDEAYWNDMPAYRQLINVLSRLKGHVNCWLAGRKDFYKRTYTEATAITSVIVKLKIWKDEYNEFLDNWSQVFGKSKTLDIVTEWAKKEKAVNEMMTNPFQLTLLAYLADEASENTAPVKSIYDLYHQFFLLWFKNEKNRGTGAVHPEASLKQLQKAARDIYSEGKYFASELDDSAVTDLLIWKSDLRQEADAFRHRSLAAFLIAYQIYNAIREGAYDDLTTALKMATKDDVTNFVLRKAEQETDSEIRVMQEHLYDYYKMLPENGDDYINVKEKVIYYISRFSGDTSEFLIPIVRSEPKSPYMRLSLAYACVLSSNKELRKYALEYARSLRNNGEDASVNRGWTVVYFGDCNKFPYTYRDEDKGPWANAREARIKRFTKPKPRIKDYRFWIFDLPLFHTFLKTRDWNDISKDEYEIIRRLDFPVGRFSSAESRFLYKEKKIF